MIISYEVRLWILQQVESSSFFKTIDVVMQPLPKFALMGFVKAFAKVGLLNF